MSARRRRSQNGVWDALESLGWGQHSLGAIAATAGVTQRQVQNVLDQLAEAGHVWRIKLWRKNGATVASVYLPLEPPASQ